VTNGEQKGTDGAHASVHTDPKIVQPGSAQASGPSPVTHHSSPSALFSFPIRIYWEDTDAGGIVYYANYFKFLERARTEWLRSLGFEQETLKQEHGLLFVVVDVEAHFRRPARYGELLRATCEIAASTRASLTFKQEIYRDGVGGELLLDGRVRVACLDAEKFRPKPLPDRLLQEKSE
jgi:acyl-CoA thioester hydrolase